MVTIAMWFSLPNMIILVGSLQPPRRENQVLQCLSLTMKRTTHFHSLVFADTLF